MNSRRKFIARKDALGALLVGVILATGVFLLWRHDLIPWPMADKIGWLFILLGVLACWDWLVVHYEITQENLIIHGGLSSRTIPLSNIDEIQERPRCLKLKCHRLQGWSWLTVSPRNRESFLQRLRQQCPWMQRG